MLVRASRAAAASSLSSTAISLQRFRSSSKAVSPSLTPSPLRTTTHSSLAQSLQNRKNSGCWPAHSPENSPQYFCRRGGREHPHERSPVSRTHRLLRVLPFVCHVR